MCREYFALVTGLSRLKPLPARNSRTAHRPTFHAVATPTLYSFDINQGLYSYGYTL
jgi:hypothetical protein